LDVFPVDKLLDGIIKLASSDATSRRACQPLIVGMMEVLELLVSYPEGSRSSLLETDTERVESLIEIMSLRDGINVDMSLSMEEMNEETPPANNLSRLDESQISLAPAEAPAKQGLNDTIRIAAACVLVRMACGEASEGTETLWQTRIRTAVMDFTSAFRLYGHPQACADMRRRVFHLQAILATLSAENENLISSSLAAEDLLCRRERHDHAQQMLDYQRDLNEARSHVTQLTAERDGYKKAMRLQAAAFKKSLQWTKSKATAEASQLVNVHVSERITAEKRANECLRRKQHLEELQQENERRIDEYRSLEAHSRQELSEIVAKLKDTHQELQHQRALVDDHESRSADQTEELSSLTSRLQSVDGEHKKTRGQLTASQAALEKTKDAYHMLHDDLEKTFAQLSFLAQAYQSQEDQITAIVEKKDQAVQEARRKADMERRRNDELEANERQLQFENDRLTKKLTKAKEKLEEERNQRHEESQRTKRHAPVAYINRLHTSTTSDASRRAQLSGKPSREERKKVLGKENRSYALPSKRDYR
jgi:myosin heavy subunit